MDASSLITRYSKAMLYAAEARGYDLPEICRIAGMTPDVVGPDALVIGADMFSRLNSTIKHALDDDFCGFMRSRVKSGSFRVVLESMVREETLGDALKRAFRIYSYITDDVTFVLHESEDTATITLTLAHPELDKFHYLHEWWLMLWPHSSSWLIGEEIPVINVDLPYEPIDPINDYAAAFWGPCRFSQSDTQVRFSTRFLHRRIIRGMSDIEESYRTRQVHLVAIPGLHRSLGILVKAKLKECLVKTERMLSIEDLAREFNVSSKTLQRRLEADGINFRFLKEEIRRDMVLNWLSEIDIPIGEVSLRAGFAGRNGLGRAVRSWVGISPKEYRGMMMRDPLRSKPVNA